MSNFKNIYGEHVAWFCYEGAISLEDLRDQKFYISDEFDVCVEDEDGCEGRCSVDVIKLLESAYAALEEKDKKIKELEELEYELHCLRERVVIGLVHHHHQ